jgi:AraC family transcriptional regulator
MEKQLRIKGMVCRRCIATVKDIFMKEGFIVTKIELGEVIYKPRHPDASLEKVWLDLQEEGFQPLDDKQSRLIARVKELVEEQVSGKANSGPNFSEVVARSIGMDYGTISSLFSQTMGVSLEQYLILRRVEKVKNLLVHTRLSFTEIAFQLGYSSVHHLSNQFKKITGLTPSQFRALQSEKSSPSQSPLG